MESNYLANRLKEVLTDGKWVTGTNYKEQIMTTPWEEAIISVNGLNSIANLTFHIHYYLDGVSRVLEGGTLDISDKYSFEAPSIQSEQDWNDLQEQFCNDSERMISLVESLPDIKLRDYFAGEKYGDNLRNIDLMIEHCYYHLGQILLIKKLIDMDKKHV